MNGKEAMEIEETIDIASSNVGSFDLMPAKYQMAAIGFAACIYRTLQAEEKQSASE